MEDNTNNNNKADEGDNSQKNQWNASMNKQNNLDHQPGEGIHEEHSFDLNDTKNILNGSQVIDINRGSNQLDNSQRLMLNPNRQIEDQLRDEQKGRSKGNKFNSSRQNAKHYARTIGNVDYEVDEDDAAANIRINDNQNSRLKIKKKNGPARNGIELTDVQLDQSPPNGEANETFPDSSVQMTLCQKVQHAFKMIGCAMSLMNLIGQIVFYMKMEFASEYLLNSYLAFIILRIVLVILVSAVFIVKNFILHYVNQMNLKVDSDGSPSLSHQYVIRRQGFIMYMSYPFMLWFGFYRIYNPKDFKIFKIIGFFLELTFSLIPLIFIQATNNATLKITTLRQIQSYSLVMGAIVIFELLAQAVVMLCELRSIRKLKATGLASEFEFNPLSEENKRRKNYKKTMIFSWAGLSIFVLAIMLCNKFIQGRSCAPGQTIHKGVCVNCEDSACSLCSVFNYCEECETGYLQIEGQCNQCDPRGLCQNCNDDYVCTKCIPGTRLQDGECFTCGHNDGCAVCKEGGCQRCKAGYYLELHSKSCIKCTDKMTSCEECSGPSTCTKCYDRIATLAVDTCQCQGLWKESEEASSCTCNDYQTLTNECSVCSDIISGCQKCTQSDNNRVFGNIEIGTANDQLGYLKCDDCGGSTMYLDMENSQCKNCSNLTPGCLQCNHLGFGCTECQKGYFINIVSTAIAFECEQCSLHLANCLSCSNIEKCQECESGYTLVNGLCQKS